MPLLKFNTSHLQAPSVRVYMINNSRSESDLSNDIFSWNGVRHSKEAIDAYLKGDKELDNSFYEDFLGHINRNYTDFDKFQDDVLSFALGRGF